MAKGDFFIVKLKCDNQDIWIPGVCDTELSTPWLGSTATGTFSRAIFAQNDLTDLLKDIDTVIPYPWQVTKFPREDTLSEAYDYLTQAFPGVYAQNTLFPAETAIDTFFNDKNVPANFVWATINTSSSNPRLISNYSLNSYSGTGTIGTSGSSELMGFPRYSFSSGVYQKNNRVNPHLTSTFLIMPDDFIIDGIITNIPRTYVYVTIYIRYDNTRDPLYGAEISSGTSLFNNNDFWLGTAQPGYEVETTDPFNPGGTTVPGGGTGDFDNTSEPVEIPELPTLSATNTGFVNLYNPDIAGLRSLANYMWSDLFSLDGWRKIMADPADAILGLSIVPVNVPQGDGQLVMIGNISTGISLPTALRQYVAVDCGTLNVNEYWGAYLDYDPYTKAEIYLPYVGTHPLAVDDIMGKPVHVVYHVDILSGACVAYVKCGDSVLYNFAGQCSCSIPITGSDWTSVVNGALSVATAVGSMVATGGATAPMLAGVASTAVNNFKPSIEKSGALSGMGGMMAIQKPYLILTRPRQALPEKQNTYTGYPSFMTVKLEDCTGYTEVESIHLEGVPATAGELTEIESLLKGGVLF